MKWFFLLFLCLSAEARGLDKKHATPDSIDREFDEIYRKLPDITVSDSDPGVNAVKKVGSYWLNKVSGNLFFLFPNPLGWRKMEPSSQTEGNFIKNQAGLQDSARFNVSLGTIVGETLLATGGDNVGIGVEDTLAKLHVFDDSLSSPLVLVSTTVGNSAPTFVISTNSRVGMGSNDPKASIHVARKLPTALEGGMILHLDESSGQTGFDETVNNNDATFSGTTIVAGEAGYGNARSFVSGNTGFVNNHSSLNPATAITVEATVNTSGSGDKMVLEKASQYSLEHQIDSSRYAFTICAVSAGCNTLVTGGGYLAGVTRQVAGTWRSSDGSQKIYVGGSEQASTTFASGDNVASTINKITIGSSTTGEFFVGTMDEVAVSTYAKTSSQVGVLETAETADGIVGLIFGGFDTPADRYGLSMSNSGIHLFSGNDDILFGTGVDDSFAEWVRFKGGEVGIGTTSPDYLLDVWGSIRSTASVHLATLGGSVGIGTINPIMSLDVSAGAIIRSSFTIGAEATRSTWTAGGNLDIFGTLIIGGQTLLARGSGNVGIGTTSPSVKFDVFGSSSIIRLGASTSCDLLTPGAVGEFCSQNSGTAPLWIGTATTVGGFAAVALQ